MSEYEHTLHKATGTRISNLQMGKDYLKVYTFTVGGIEVERLFTLQSLADCMGWGKGAMEQRYARGRLYHWKRDIPTGNSRPVRGFLFAQLQDVIRVMTDRHAKVDAKPAGTNVVSNKRRSESSPVPLVFELHAGRKYITMPALARHYGRSVTAIRNKLSKANLLKKGVNLNDPTKGGRPRRGFPEEMYRQLVDAIENGAQFLNEAQIIHDRVMRQPRETERQMTDDELIAQGEAAFREVFGDQQAQHPLVADPWSQIEQLKPPAA